MQLKLSPSHHLATSKQPRPEGGKQSTVITQPFYALLRARPSRSRHHGHISLGCMLFKQSMVPTGEHELSDLTRNTILTNLISQKCVK